MFLKSTKILLLGSTIALLAAGCGNNQPQANNQNSVPTSAAAQTQAAYAGSASTTRSGFGMQNLPPGSKPFFGTIVSVSGSQVTISGRSRNSSSTVSTIIDISGTTQFQGGAQSDLVSGTRIAGAGTVNSDGSIAATSLQINPSFAGRGQGRHGQTYQPPSSQ